MDERSEGEVGEMTGDVDESIGEIVPTNIVGKPIEAANQKSRYGNAGATSK